MPPKKRAGISHYAAITCGSFRTSYTVMCDRSNQMFVLSNETHGYRRPQILTIQIHGKHSNVFQKGRRLGCPNITALSSSTFAFVELHTLSSLKGAVVPSSSLWHGVSEVIPLTTSPSSYLNCTTNPSLPFLTFTSPSGFSIFTSSIFPCGGYLIIISSSSKPSIVSNTAQRPTHVSGDPLLGEGDPEICTLRIQFISWCGMEDRNIRAMESPENVNVGLL